MPFFTNSRFNIRMFVRDTPNRSESDVRGNSCDGTIFGSSDPSYLPSLRVKVCVRSTTSSCWRWETHSFRGPSRQWNTEDHTIQTIQVPNTNEPLVVEVLDVQWDWACENYYQNDPNPRAHLGTAHSVLCQRLRPVFSLGFNFRLTKRKIFQIFIDSKRFDSKYRWRVSSTSLAYFLSNPGHVKLTSLKESPIMS